MTNSPNCWGIPKASMSAAMSGSPREGGRRRVIRVVIKAEKVTWEQGKLLQLKYI